MKPWAFEWEQLEKVHFPVAIVLYGNGVSFSPFDLKSLRSFSDFGQRSLGWNLFTFSQKLLGPVAMLTTVLAMLPYIYIRSVTNAQTASIAGKSNVSGGGDRDLMVLVNIYNHLQG